ncbi:MAG TPA: CHAP domain-containing protein [Gaiellaceae bacterium]|jgi:hypothetical protein|nr:CHAP domain-containing protein [Gaiellaceae bacterium]
MTAWWEEPYKGGPMVAVPGFPRPLYPPDAAPGKQPSINGPDVEAYKRTVWRAGRWPGPASNFDRAYSNGFAHGKSGNVVETGIAGVQRQQSIDDTGWIGKNTFNTLRSIRVPSGPHEGEMAMDANAANLIAQAWELYGGSEPPPPSSSSTTTRQKALRAAISYLGYKESPAGSNHTKFGSWYGVDYQPWCAIFCTYCFELEAGGSPSFVKGQNYAYVPYVVSDARAGRNGLNTTSSPIPGDLVCFDWGFDGTYDHIGIFEAWAEGSGSTFTAIEGNTSIDNNSNGGEVMRRTRRVPDQATTFVRVAQ